MTQQWTITGLGVIRARFVCRLKKARYAVVEAQEREGRFQIVIGYPELHFIKFATVVRELSRNLVGSHSTLCLLQPAPVGRLAPCR
jgi:hypothetical protein